jgi:hypothetical protein
MEFDQGILETTVLALIAQSTSQNNARSTIAERFPIMR